MPELFIVAIYFSIFVLVLIPYYNWFYRVMVNLLHAASFWLSLFSIALILAPVYICKRRFKRSLLVIALGLLVFFAGSRVHDWRYHITSRYIRDNYCKANMPAEESLILGGIREVKVSGIERTGAFENSSHCLIVVCTEEFYYCDNAVITIGQ